MPPLPIRKRYSKWYPSKRNGVRPKTLVGPLHIQYSGHGDSEYLNQLVKNVLTCAYIDPTASSGRPADTVYFRLEETAAANQPSAFIGAKEFARVYLGVPTIVLALPLLWAHCAIVRGWAEPHYLHSFGLLPAGAVLLYAPGDLEELAVCYFLFYQSYRFACKLHRPTYRPSRGEQVRSSVSSKEPYVFRLASSWNIASPLSAFDCGKYSCTLIASFSTSR